MKKLLIAALMISVCAPTPVFAGLGVKDNANANQTINTHTINGNFTPDHFNSDSLGGEPIGKTVDPSSCTTDTTANNLVAMNKCLITKMNALLTALGSPEQAGATKPVSAAALPLPVGAATSAKQDTLAGLIGPGNTGPNCAVDTTQTDLLSAVKCEITKQNAILAQLQATLNVTGSLSTTPAASELHLGEVGNNMTVAGASFTAASGTTAYSPNVVVASSTTLATVNGNTNNGIMAFPVCRGTSGAITYTGTLWRARFKTTDSGFAGQSVILKLYRDMPTLFGTQADHGAWSTSESNYLGTITVSVDQSFSADTTPTWKGVGTPSVGSMINYDCASGSNVIYGLEVANGNFSPQGAKVHTWALEVTRN